MVDYALDKTSKFYAFVHQCSVPFPRSPFDHEIKYSITTVSLSSS